jgi:DNA mismatch endonuclease, patch repair protein
MDTVSPQIRSSIMSRIKQRDTGLEVQLRRALWKAGFRYRKNVRIFGTPDLVLARSKVLVFVDSCFWHGCKVHCRKPKSNTMFWETKISRNQIRDRKVAGYYRRRGVTVLRIWEHDIQANLDGCLMRVAQAVNRARAK